VALDTCCYVSIPLAILSSLVVLYFLGHTLNTMISRAGAGVGILVDDSTVTIETRTGF